MNCFSFSSPYYHFVQILSSLPPWVGRRWVVGRQRSIYNGFEVELRLRQRFQSIWQEVSDCCRRSWSKESVTSPLTEAQKLTEPIRLCRQDVCHDHEMLFILSDGATGWVKQYPQGYGSANQKHSHRSQVMPSETGYVWAQKHTDTRGQKTCSRSDYHYESAMFRKRKKSIQDKNNTEQQSDKNSLVSHCLWLSSV